MLPELSLSSFTKSDIDNSISIPIQRPISTDVIKETIHSKLDLMPLSMFHIKIILISVLLFVTQGFEIAYIFYQRYHYDSNSYMQHIYYDSIAKAVFILGQGIGAVLFSIATMHKGRLCSLRILIIVYCFSSFALYFIRNHELNIYKSLIFILMNVFRSVLGCAIGGFHMSEYSIIDEITPKKWRGKVNMLLLSVGIPIGMVIYYAIEYIYTSLSLWFTIPNQISNLSRLMPVLYTFPLLFVDPLYLSSPRWEMFIGKFRDAKRIMNEIENNNKDEANNANNTQTNTNTNRNSYRYTSNSSRMELGNCNSTRVVPNIMFNRKYFWSLNILKCIQSQRKRSIYCITILILFSMYQYMFTFIANLSLYDHNDNTVIFYSITLSHNTTHVFQSGIQLIGGLLMTLFIDVFKRQVLLKILTSFILISSILIGLNHSLFLIPLKYELIFVIVFILAGCGFNITFSLIGELYPIEFRIQIICITYCLSLLIGLGSLLGLYWFHIYYMAYLVYGGVCVISLFMIHYTGIDTRNTSLEQLNSNIIMSDFTEIANISKI